MSEELKPCPLCGGEADTNTFGNQPRKQYYMSCMNPKCGLDGPVKYSLEDAIKTWNTDRDPWVKITCDDDLPKENTEVLWLADNGYIEYSDFETYFESGRNYTHYQTITLPKT